MRFDYGRVKALFTYEAATTYLLYRVNAYIRRRPELCILGKTCFRQTPDMRRRPSGKVAGAIQEDLIR